MMFAEECCCIVAAVELVIKVRDVKSGKTNLMIRRLIKFKLSII